MAPALQAIEIAIALPFLTATRIQTPLPVQLQPHLPRSHISRTPTNSHKPLPADQFPSKKPANPPFQKKNTSPDKKISTPNCRKKFDSKQNRSTFYSVIHKQSHYRLCSVPYTVSRMTSDETSTIATHLQTTNTILTTQPKESDL